MAIETDVKPELGHKQANYYQCQIRVLHWMVKIGCVEIMGKP